VNTQKLAQAGVFGNLHLKGVSLLLAVGLWSVVPDPTVPHIVTGVPVQLQNVPADLALADATIPNVEVHVRGAALRTRDLTPGEIAPRPDLFGAFEGDNTVFLTPEMIDAPFGVSVERVVPAQLTIRLEQRVRREVPVSVVVEGSPDAGYEIYDKIVTPPTVPVSGPESRIATLEDIATEKVSVARRRDTLTRTLRVIPEDPTIRLEGVDEVQVTVAIEEQPITRQFPEIDVAVTSATTRVVVNPAIIGVVVEGPPSMVDMLTAENFVATIDVAGLEPRREDYRLEPVVVVQPAELAAQITVIAITPQRRLDVHVFAERP
jgi:hypothetical protein